MAHPCAPCFGVIESSSRYVLWKSRCPQRRLVRSNQNALRTAHATTQHESARRPPHAMDCRGTDHLFVRDRQFAVAARRLRSSQTGVHFIRNGQGGPLALSAHATRTNCDKAAVGRLDFGCVFRVTRSWEIAWRLPSLVAALALAVVLFRAANERVWKSRRGNCSRGVWTESAESAVGHARAHRHATGARDFSDRPADLAKDPTTETNGNCAIKCTSLFCSPRRC